MADAMKAAEEKKRAAVASETEDHAKLAAPVTAASTAAVESVLSYGLAALKAAETKAHALHLNADDAVDEGMELEAAVAGEAALRKEDQQKAVDVAKEAIKVAQGAVGTLKDLKKAKQPEAIIAGAKEAEVKLVEIQRQVQLVDQMAKKVGAAAERRHAAIVESAAARAKVARLEEDAKREKAEAAKEAAKAAKEAEKAKEAEELLAAKEAAKVTLSKMRIVGGSGLGASEEIKAVAGMARSPTLLVRVAWDKSKDKAVEKYQEAVNETKELIDNYGLHEKKEMAAEKVSAATVAIIGAKKMQEWVRLPLTHLTRAQCSVLSAQCSVLSAQCAVRSAPTCPTWPYCSQCVSNACPTRAGRESGTEEGTEGTEEGTEGTEEGRGGAEGQRGGGEQE